MSKLTEPVKVEASRKKGPKVLSEISVKRSMDGGHIVEHRYEGYQHEPRSYQFAPGEADRAKAHILRHTGLGEGAAPAEE
jgi:hypothetical protein